MGRMYGADRTCHPLTPPRPKPDPILDDRTGDAAKDGYTAVGPRRPRSGDQIMDAERADMADRYDNDADDGYGPMIGWSDW